MRARFNLKKTIVSILIASLLIVSLSDLLGVSIVRADDVSNTSTDTGLTEEALLWFAPQYLNNAYYNSQYAELEGYCSEIVDNYITPYDTDSAAIAGAFKNGDKIITQTILHNLFGYGDSFEESNNKKLAGALLNEFFVVDTANLGLIKDIDAGIGWVRDTYGLGKSITTEQLKDNLKNSELKLSDEQIDGLFAYGDMEDKLLSYYSTFEDACDAYVTCCELYQYESEAIDILLRHLNLDSPIYQGLNSIRKDMEKNPVEYIYENYVSDKIVGKLAGSAKSDFLSSLGSTVTTDYAFALFIGDVIGTIYEEFHPSYNDYFYATMMMCYVREADRAVSSVISGSSDNTIEQVSISDYKCCYNFYLSCLKLWMKKCIKVAPDNTTAKAEISYAIVGFDEEYNYEDYMSLCLSNANNDLNNGTLVLNQDSAKLVSVDNFLYAVRPYGNAGVEIFRCYVYKSVATEEEYDSFLDESYDVIYPNLICGLPVLCVSNDYYDPYIRYVPDPYAFLNNSYSIVYPCIAVKTLGPYTGDRNTVVFPDTLIEMGYHSATDLSDPNIIPNGVEIIGYSAFESYSGEEIIIPDSVTTIKEYAFDSSFLTSISIPDGVVSIEWGAFAGCNSLTSIIIPSSVELFGDPNGFDPLIQGCVIYYEGTQEEWMAMSCSDYDTWGGDWDGSGEKLHVPDCFILISNFDRDEANNLTVSFESNGIGAVPEPIMVQSGNVILKPSFSVLLDPIVSGYTFGGWYTDSACTTAFDFNSAITTDITLYAKWVDDSSGSESWSGSSTTPTPTPTNPTPTAPAPMTTVSSTPTPTPKPVEPPKLTTGVAHVQDIGNVSYTTEAGVLTIGTRGMGKRLEEITINFENTTGLSGTLEYRVHVQDYGWMEWVPAGTKCGTEGEAKRIEAIEIRFTGELADYYSVEYCVHIQDYGDMQGWVKDGALAGTTGESKRIEELKIRIVPKHSGSSMSVKYRVHIQDYGWEGAYASNGQMSGTSGESKRLEGIEIFLDGNQYSGGVKFKTHVQDYGWQGWSYDGEMSGTQGESKRLEGICIELYGEIAEYYDIYYRVHAQDIGWMAWAKNGECAGTAGRSARLEGIQIVLVPKGSPAPGVTYEGITAVTDKAFIEGF